MYFSINAYKTILGQKNTYRLKKDEDWVQHPDFTSFSPKTDKLFKTYMDAQQWLVETGRVFINGEAANTMAQLDGEKIGRSYTFEIIAHRISKPKNPLFTREQLECVLKNGNDNYTNCLVMDLEGFPRLIQLVHDTPLTLQEYPVRFETFVAGNGYVGHDCSMDHLERTYMAILEAWNFHLASGCSTYCDMESGAQSESELIDEIKSIVHHLK